MFGNQSAREAARAARLIQLEMWRQEEMKERQAKLAANGGIPLTSNAGKSRRAEENLDDPTKPRFRIDLMFALAVRDRDIALATRLLKKGANIMTNDFYGLTPLHRAVTNDDRAMVEFLLANGANMEATDQDGWTPLHAAAHWGSNKGACC
jgi:ankyrin repeat protein